MSRNDQSNRIIKWLVMAGDIVVLNVVMLAFAKWHWRMETWGIGRVEIYILVNNIALMLAMLQFSTIIHLRLVNAGDILRRMVGLTMLQAVLAYLLLKVFAYNLPIGWLILEIGTVFTFILVMKRLAERWMIKLYREVGRNTRMVTLVGQDHELEAIEEKLMKDATLGYKIVERYPNVDDFVTATEAPEQLKLGEELYLCVSRKRKDVIRRISWFCDSRVIRFYYVPVSVESIGLNLKREMLDDMEVFTTYENPLQNSVNRTVKRLFDIVLSLIALGLTGLIFPFVWLTIKIQSPGPIFFKQKRTGLDGRNFYCYKFRSMHVNKDADRVQATKDDPRKYPFGNFMRKTNIDELPQFWNVLKGDMSIVGPRPHMLAHTEMYSQLISKYMVRHFVKPGITGWAQVSGFRGETKELWQMEERVKHDIWYMENWSFWLDIRIMWFTVKTFFIHDKNAY